MTWMGFVASLFVTVTVCTQHIVPSLDYFLQARRLLSADSFIHICSNKDSEIIWLLIQIDKSTIRLWGLHLRSIPRSRKYFNLYIFGVLLYSWTKMLDDIFFDMKEGKISNHSCADGVNRREEELFYPGTPDRTTPRSSHLSHVSV